MKRVRVDTLPHSGALPPGAAHHLLNVMRARPGRALILFDGLGHEQPAVLALEEGVAHAVPSGPVRDVPAAPPIDLIVAVLKHQAMDLAVRMATEAGVRAIHPVITERTIAKGDRSERWARIASSAAAQSGRAHEPELHPVRPLRDVVAAYEGPIFTGTLGGSEPERLDQACAVCIGPAGGFSPTELAWLADRTLPVSLGPHVLRAETACAVAVALLRPQQG